MRVPEEGQAFRTACWYHRFRGIKKHLEIERSMGILVPLDAGLRVVYSAASRALSTQSDGSRRIPSPVKSGRIPRFAAPEHFRPQGLASVSLYRSRTI